MRDKARSLKIMYLLPELNVGGVETHVLAMSEGMRKAGHEAIVVSNGGALLPRLEASGVRHITLPIHRKSPSAVRKMAGAVRAIALEEGVDIVHAHSRVPAWVAHFASKGLRSAFIITAHGQYAPHLGSSVMTKGDRIICVSEVIREHMRERLGADPAKMRVVYNGIDIEAAERSVADRRPGAEVRAELGVPESAPVIGSVGRLTVAKGFRFLLEAFRRLRERMPEARALIVGDGPMNKELSQLAAELGVADRVVFTGVRTDIYDLLGAMDAYVVSSVFEGFPMGCLEAMAARVPIAATNVGGIPEMLEDGRAALLVEPKNPEALAEAARRLLEDRRFAAGVAAEAREDLERKFSQRKMLDDTLGIYCEALRQKRGYVGPVAGAPTADKPRALLTLPELRVGGVETHVIDLAVGLKEKGYIPLVVSFGGKLVEKLEAAGIEHVKMPVHVKSPIPIFKMVGPMRQIIEDRRIELVHAHSRVPAWICSLALRGSGSRRIPFVTTCHSTYSVHAGSRVMVGSDGMLAVSEYVRRHMLEHFGPNPDDIRTVHNGVSPDIYDESREEEIRNRYRAELGISPSSKVVGMVASLTPRKGYHHLVSASAAVLRENPDTVFLGVGGGPQLDELEKQARELGVSERFRFLGVRNDVRDLLCLFDIFTLASASEGLPYVILEAMCMKRAIVTTDVGGIPEALEHENNGLLVKPGDVAQLAGGINRLLADEALAGRIAAAARQTVINSFTVSRMVDKTEETYRKLLA